MATKKALVKELISLKERRDSIDKEIEDLKKDLYKIFDDEGSEGPTFILNYPKDMESIAEIEEYWAFRNPGALIKEIDELNRVIYGFYPRSLQKSSFEEEGYGKIERRISYPSPKVDLDSLKEKNPDLFDKVTTLVAVFDDEKFGVLMESGQLDDDSFEPFVQGVTPRVSFHIIPEKEK